VSPAFIKPQQLNEPMSESGSDIPLKPKSNRGRKKDEPLSPKHCGWNGGPLNKRGLPCRGLHRKGGNKRCKRHGGMTPPPGPTHPNWKHGRYSRAFPQRLRDRYEEALRDPDLLSAKEATAILSTRLVDLLKRLDSGENDDLLGQIVEAWTEFKAASKRAMNAGDDDKARQKAREDAHAATQALDRLTAASDNDRQVWEDIRVVTKEFVTVSSFEHKRMVDLNQMITVEQIMILSSALLQMNRQIIERYAAMHNFDSKAALAEIGHGFAALFNRGFALTTRQDLVVRASNTEKTEILDVTP
jgi:hypothetical protein